jgi:hypothetical protein
MQAMLDNLINGNLTDAKNQAKKYSYWKIMSYMEQTAGYGLAQSVAIAGYLKGNLSFQTYADTMCLTSNRA